VDGVQISGGRYNFDGPATNKAYQYELGYTHIFTPSLLMDLRAGYTRISNLSPLNYDEGQSQLQIRWKLGLRLDQKRLAQLTHHVVPGQSALCGGLNTSPF
jgi:hypothetical protein